MRVSGSQTLLIGASPAACRAALLDLAAYPDWYPGVRAAELIDAGGDGAAARLLFGTGLPVLAEIACVLRLEPREPDRLEPNVEGGGLRIDGRGWTLEPQADSATRVTYEIGAEMSVPGGFVTERLVKGKARYFLIEAPLAALKRRVEPPA
ncbi:MAG: SRPBCC family protein [Solirubrobacteraceae bacterium]